MDINKSAIFVGSLYFLSLYACKNDEKTTGNKAQKPNFLIIISDDQSWVHAGAYGCNYVRTPEFDSLAHKGLLFKNAFCPAPHSSASRASLLTGMNPWQLEEAGTHFGNFPVKFKVFPDILEENGYLTGATGKGWGPGNWKVTGRKRNPAGNMYNKYKLDNLPAKFLGDTDPAKNFEDFLSGKKKNQPFCFWYGSSEPHVEYENGIGIKNGIDTSKIILPTFLPSRPDVKIEIADYLFEIEWFDKQVGRLIKSLKKLGLDENTIIVVTSDNGIVSPHAKRSLYEWGTHIPMVISWPKILNKGKLVDRLTSFIDIAPTFLELAGIAIPPEMTGKSFAGLFIKEMEMQKKDDPDFVLTGFERHDHRRFDNLGYPMRAIRSNKYLYIRNYKPDRWPEGDPVINEYGKKGELSLSSWTPYYSYFEPGTGLFNLAFGKRDAEELYDINVDPECINNLIDNREYRHIADSLSNILKNELIIQHDPRELGYGDIFESYPYYGMMKQNLGGFKETGQYNPAYHVHPIE
jgi:N-sulfoglucosamine sulfohydrolase